MSETVCDSCGLKGCFCGYHNLGPLRKSVCVSCGEQEIEVFRLTLNNELGGYYVDAIEDAARELAVLNEHVEDGDSYSIIPEKMLRVKFLSLPEFDGF